MFFREKGKVILLFILIPRKKKKDSVTGASLYKGLAIKKYDVKRNQ